MSRHPESDEADELEDLRLGDWKIVGSHRNPWGKIPLTDRGRSLEGRAREYVTRLAAVARQPDPESRRHHYVPKTYLKRWSADGKRVWNLDTVTRQVRALSLNSVCVQENFYRVVGRDGRAHNRVEGLFGVVDSELRRIQQIFVDLTDPDQLEFDDLIGLGVVVAVQRMRTAQQRRIRLQHDAWVVAQNPEQFTSMVDPSNPFRVAGVHTELLFSSMWEAADVMTTRYIEVWDDPSGRFWTCDAPVLVPYRKNVRPDLFGAPYVLWPISPHRVVALTNKPSGEKAVISRATSKQRGIVRDAVLQGRERWIFASGTQADELPATKAFRRRAQMRFRCSQWTPRGRYVEPPGCCVEQGEWFGSEPDVALCDQGLHRDAPDMWHHV